MALFDFGDPSVRRGGVFAELCRVMARYDAIGRAAGKLDHARLVLDIGSLIRFSERGAGAMLRQIAIEITVV